MEKQLKDAIIAGVEQLYGSAPAESQITLQKTKKEFAGDWTLVTFPLLKLTRKKSCANRSRNRRVFKRKRIDCSRF